MRFGGLLGVGLCLALAAPTASRAQEREPIDETGWQNNGTSIDGEFTVLVQGAKRGPSYPRVWLRYEYLKGARVQHDGFRAWSSSVLYDVDCKEDRTRLLSLTVYAKPNLGGDNRSAEVPSEWQFQRPDTMGYIAVEALCPRGD